MTLQYLIIAITIALAIAYAGYRVITALTREDARCAGCALKENCAKNKRQKGQNCKK